MKSSINRIFLPTDFSESALNAYRIALWLADSYHATIDIWHYVAVETVPGDVPVLSGEVTRKHVEVAKDVIETFKNAGLSQVIERHELSYRPQITTHVEVGAPSRLIAKNVLDGDYDLIIMGTQGEHSTLEKLFGSVTTATINRAPCHVMAIPDSYQDERMKNIAIATDLNESVPEVILKTTQLFNPLKSNFRVVHAEPKGSGDNSIELGILKAYLKSNAPQLDISFHTIFGDKTMELLDKFISTESIDMMIMYRPERNFFDQLFHRSITRQLALHTRIPLFIIK